jgi:hypothetical protein
MLFTLDQRIRRQMDKEFHWFLHEISSQLFREYRERDEKMTRGKFCEGVAKRIGGLLIDREGEAAKGIELKEFEMVGYDAIYGINDEISAAGSDAVALHVAEMCVAFLEVRKMGVRSPYLEKPKIWDDYNPFANEGGFCNPMKLKMMDD